MAGLPVLVRTGLGRGALLLLPLATSLCTGCFFKLPETPQIDIPQLESDALVPLDGFDPGDTAYDLSDTYPEMIWIPDDTAEATEWVESDADLVEDLPEPDTTLIWLENCTFPLSAFTDQTMTQSFVRFAQSLITPVDPTLPPEEVPPADKLYVYYLTCGLEISSYSPERGYAVRIDQPGSVHAKASCDHKCYIYVHKDGCNFNNLVGCWSQDSQTPELTMDVLPGLYLISVEYVEADVANEFGLTDFTTVQFDLHVAVNNADGQSECLTESQTQPFPSDATCDEPGVATWQQEIPGVLGWSSPDDYLLGCHIGDVQADPIGGMPDQTHQLTIPAEWKEPVRVTAEVSFGESEAELSHILAVTTAPCGATESIMECGWGSQGTLVVSDLLVLPGETVYAIVDGMGKDALLSQADQSYTLTWRLSGSCSKTP